MWPFRSRERPPPLPARRAASCGRPSKPNPAIRFRLPSGTGSADPEVGLCPERFEARDEELLQPLLVARRLVEVPSRRVAGDELAHQGDELVAVCAHVGNDLLFED